MQLLAVTKDESVMISILSLFASSVKTDDGRSITIQRIHRTFDVLLHNDAAFMLVALLKHSSTTVQERTFQIIGIILSNGNETHIQLILDANVLPIMRSLLLLPNESIRGKTCLALSNIMVEPNNIEKAIAADLFPLLLHLINVPSFIREFGSTKRSRMCDSKCNRVWQYSTSLLPRWTRSNKAFMRFIELLSSSVCYSCAGR